MATLAEARMAVARGTETNYLRAYAIQQAERVARQYGLDPERFANTFVALITQESGWNPQAYNPSGASGIAQIMPQYHPGVDPWNPEQALSYAAEYLGSLVKRYNGDFLRGAAAYNYGPGNVDRLAGLDNQSFYRNLPSETQLYVRNVVGYQPIQLPNTGGGMPPRQQPQPTPTPPTPEDPIDQAILRWFQNQRGQEQQRPMETDIPGLYLVPDGQGGYELQQLVPEGYFRRLSEQEKVAAQQELQDRIALEYALNQLPPTPYQQAQLGVSYGNLTLNQQEFAERQRMNEFERFVNAFTLQQAAQEAADARREAVQNRLLEAAPNLTMGREFYGGFEPFGAYSAVANFAGVPFTPRSTAQAQIPLSTDTKPAPVPADPLLAAILERL